MCRSRAFSRFRFRSLAHSITITNWRNGRRFGRQRRVNHYIVNLLLALRLRQSVVQIALHFNTLLAFGMYGEVLPNQNGAPVRLVVPWKYGFKSAKSIVKIRFVEKEPGTAWNKAAQQEYGFYSNVNPNVDHPRWSQATERRIGEDGLFAKKRKTLMFNGYEAQVGQLYAGMDLKKFY